MTGIHKRISQQVYQKSGISRLHSKVKKKFQQMANIEHSAHSIALGFAVGTFIAIFPTVGFTILLAVLVALLFKKLNRIALFVAFAVWNPLVLTPIYWLSYHLGDALFGGVPVVEYHVTYLHQIFNFSRRFLIGNVMIGLVLSIISYYVVWFAVVKIRKKKLARRD